MRLQQISLGLVNRTDVWQSVSSLPRWICCSGARPRGWRQTQRVAAHKITRLISAGVSGWACRLRTLEQSHSSPFLLLLFCSSFLSTCISTDPTSSLKLQPSRCLHRRPTVKELLWRTPLALRVSVSSLSLFSSQWNISQTFPSSEPVGRATYTSGLKVYTPRKVCVTISAKVWSQTLEPLLAAGSGSRAAWHKEQKHTAGMDLFG